MAASIREKQINALKRMLNFNENITKASVTEPQWKVLVYDRWGQDIISPLLSVRELRDMGVTLHLLLHTDRESIPDVPAVYFVMPTEDNITRIARDLDNQLYESYYLNFISAINRQRLEDLAQSCIDSNSVVHISKVFDQYLNFISLEDDMFTLRHQNSDSISYYAINRGDVKDTEIESIMDSIVESLFSMCVTLGTVPIIRCPRGNAAEQVAEKLDKKLRNNLKDTRNSLFSADTMQSGQFSFQRPLLVIVDRNMDLATPFHHTWTYQALAHDVLNLQLNRVEIEETKEVPSPGGTRSHTTKKSFDLNKSDNFWLTHKGSPFPEVAEAVQVRLEVYRTQEDEVKRLKSAMGIDGDESDAAVGLLSDNTARITSAVSSLPELLEMKRLIDMHTCIATALLKHIKDRKLDVYFETEEKLMGKLSLDKPLMEIIQDPEGLPEDKERLFIISLICGPSMSETEIDQYCMALQDCGCNLNAVQYIRRWRNYTKVAVAPTVYGGAGTKTVGMFSKLMSHASSFAMEGVKNLVVKKHNLPVTKVVDSLMELKSSPETDDYRYFDPKLLRATDSGSIPRNRSPFQEAIVFMVGGGNYIEYQNLVDYVKSKASHTPKKVVYGCSELLSASQFLKQLSRLGSEIR